MTAPNSMSSIVVSCIAPHPCQDVGDGGGAVGGAHHDHHVAGAPARSPGRGLAMHLARRGRTATIEAPVRVRTRVSPIGRPAYGESPPIGSCSLTSPSTSRCSSFRRCTMRGAPSSSASASASSSFSLTVSHARIGVVRIVDHQVPAAGAVGDDPDPPPGSRR